MSFRKSKEAGACRVSGLVKFSYADSGSCQYEVCKSFRAAIAQKLSDEEEVNVYLVGIGISVGCSYVMTFNSTTAMEAAGIHQFLRQKEFFSEYLSRHFSWLPQPMLPTVSHSWWRSTGLLSQPLPWLPPQPV